MLITLQQLRLFEAVARNNSFTRASEELDLSQPAVSIQIKKLEEQIGLPLFEQVGKKIFMTNAGRALYESSGDILARVAILKSSLEDLKGVVQGPLRISAVTTAKYFMPHLLGEFLQQYPDVVPQLNFTNRANIMQRLHNNEDDFVVVGQLPNDPSLEAYDFLDNILVVAAPPKHRLVGQQNIALSELSQERFLSREAGSGTRLAFEHLLTQHNLTVTPYMELGSSEAIKQSVIAGLGVAVLSLHSLKLELNAGALVRLDVAGFPLRCPWYAVHLRGKRMSLVARTFLDFMLSKNQREIFGQNGVEP